MFQGGVSQIGRTCMEHLRRGITVLIREVPPGGLKGLHKVRPFEKYTYQGWTCFVQCGFILELLRVFAWPYTMGNVQRGAHNVTKPLS